MATGQVDQKDEQDEVLGFEGNGVAEVDALNGLEWGTREWATVFLAGQKLLMKRRFFHQLEEHLST